MLRPDREHPYDLYQSAVRYAQKGYGHEDVLVMLQLAKTPENKAWVRRIVMSIRAEYRGWKR